MRRFVFSPRYSCVALVACLMIALPLAADAQTPLTPPAQERPDSFADLADRLLPAVVNISSTQKIEAPQDMPEMPQFPPGSPFEDFFEDFMDKRGMNAPPVPASSLGSGFVIDAEKGLIVTNNHVIRDADEVRVTFHDDDTVKAEIIGRDEKTDLALLKVTEKKNLVAVTFGNSDAMRVGDWVLAIGNPFGLGGTVTAGIVSARQRDIQAGPYDDFIQTDASINRGNSGGPMFNLKGEVIGINTAIYSPSGGSVGIGFAIPSALAKPVIDQIAQYGRTKRGWLGVRVQSVTDDIAESLNLQKSEGALVASVIDKSPAAEVGIKAGDIILSFNGQKLNAMRQLPRLVAEAPIGTEAEIVYWRNGKETGARVKIAELEQAEEAGLIPTADNSDMETPGGTKVPAAGVTVDTITDNARKNYAIPADVQGLVIVDVDPMSEAAEKGLSPGDVIVEINQTGVQKPQDITTQFDKAMKDGRKSVLLLLNREGEVRFVALKPSPAKANTGTAPKDKDKTKGESTAE